MAPKKKIRNNKAKKIQEDGPRPLPTVPCEACGDPITIPRTCRHGKKLINCQGTGCTTAHFDEHNAHCNGSLAIVRPSAPLGLSKAEVAAELDDPELRQQLGLNRTEASVIQSQEIRERLKRRGETLANIAPVRLAAMGLLTHELNAVIRTRAGKPARYVEGLPFVEWFSKLEKGPILRVDEWTEKFKSVVEGRQTVEEIGYDDEESEVEGETCPTPENDD